MELRKQHFSEFLKMYKISDKLLYLLVFIIANYQYNIEDSKGHDHFLSTEDFINRINKFLRSAGVHSNYPYLYTNYGTSDILQGFSRSSAIYGSLFVVNQKVNFDEINLLDEEEKVNEQEYVTRFKIKSKMAGNKEYLGSNMLVMSKDYA
jgi:RAB protein geranylgeranyltransferase component A